MSILDHEFTNFDIAATDEPRPTPISRPSARYTVGELFTVQVQAVHVLNQQHH
jgi:hypothetical protein